MSPLKPPLNMIADRLLFEDDVVLDDIIVMDCDRVVDVVCVDVEIVEDAVLNVDDEYNDVVDWDDEIDVVKVVVDDDRVVVDLVRTVVDLVRAVEVVGCLSSFTEGKAPKMIAIVTPDTIVIPRNIQIY